MREFKVSRSTAKRWRRQPKKIQVDYRWLCHVVDTDQIRRDLARELEMKALQGK